VKICNQLVKKVKKYGLSDKTQGGQIWFLQEAKRVLEKGQMKIVEPASIIWDQISEIWSQKDQPGNSVLTYLNQFIAHTLSGFLNFGYKANFNWQYLFTQKGFFF